MSRERERERERERDRDRDRDRDTETERDRERQRAEDVKWIIKGTSLGPSVPMTAWELFALGP